MQQAASNAQLIAKNATISWIVLNARQDMNLIVFILAVSLNVKSTRLSLLMNVFVIQGAAEMSKEFVKSVLWVPSNMEIDVRNADKIAKYAIQIRCAPTAKMVMH